MFNSSIIEIVLGLILVYFMLSLLIATLNELVASVLLDLRAEMLRKAIFEMLGKNEGLTRKFYDNQLVKSLGHSSLRNFYNKKKPSYISSSTFSAVVIRLLKLQTSKISTPPDSPGDDKQQLDLGKSLKESIDRIKDEWESLQADIKAGDSGREELIEALETLYVACLNEPERFPAKLEEWFNETMNRVSGWYKRWMKLISFVIGFVIVVLINADTINIINYLKANPEARMEMMAKVDEVLQDSTLQNRINQKVATKQDSAAIKRLDSLYQATLELAHTDVREVSTLAGMGWRNMTPGKYFKQPENKWVLSIFGWLLTSIALVLGAPFWFDLLSKVSKLRSSGDKPSGKTEAEQLTPPGR